MKDEALKGAIGAEYQKSPWDGKGISMPPPEAPVQEPFCFYYVENGEEYFAPKGAYVPDNAQPLYTTPPAQPAPVQEPVAWIHVDAYQPSNRHLEWKENCKGYEGDWVKHPLYTTPPAAPDLQAELDATNRQVEILSDALAESRREVAALKAVQEPVEVDQTTMELAESVGLIGPASRTHDLHAAIQRFHDLICVNATIKAAKMAADAIRESTPPAAPVAWKWHQAPVRTSWGHEMVVADLAIDKDNTVSVYCERDQTAKVEAMFNPPAAQRPDVDAMIALARADEREACAKVCEDYTDNDGGTFIDHEGHGYSCAAAIRARSCPPCNEDCDQGRNCPARKDK